MPQLKIYLMEKWMERLREIAADYDIGMSDLMNELVEWVLDQEDDFLEDLEEDLGFEEIEEEEASAEETEKVPVSEEVETEEA